MDITYAAWFPWHLGLLVLRFLLGGGAVDWSHKYPARLSGVS